METLGGVDAAQDIRSLPIPRCDIAACPRLALILGYPESTGGEPWLLAGSRQFCEIFLPVVGGERAQIRKSHGADRRTSIRYAWQSEIFNGRRGILSGGLHWLPRTSVGSKSCTTEMDQIEWAQRQ
eukprot:INCI6718.1.p1 GENE.INCI6718.1~~INCI6718.1.p1  ORF type:complete len:126 (-),score=0.84 INCI6718.1:251-628(-)